MISTRGGPTIRTPTAEHSRHVVILALDTLGDLVLRQPLFSELLDRNHAVTVVVRRGYDDIIPHLDTRLESLTIGIDPHRLPEAAARDHLETLAGEIARLGPDVLVAAAHNRTYAEEWILRQFPECETVGFDLPHSPLDRLPAEARPQGSKRSELLSRPVTCAVDDHESSKQRALFAAIAGTEMPERLPRIVLEDSQREAAAGVAREMGLEPGRYVFGCPAGTVTVPLKAWPVEQFVEIAARVWKEHRLPTLLAGVPPEAPFLHEIAEAGAKSGVRLPVWIGDSGSMGTLLGLIAHSRLYLGNDSGPMHCAGALGVPVVARFGGGHWPRFLPLARRAFSATQRLPCFGCAWQCWLDTPACMTTIDAGTFVEGVDWALSSEDEERRVDVGRALDPRTVETLVAASRVTTRLRATLEAEKSRASISPAGTVAARPKVFVVTPSFNQGRYLRETIDSVLSQDYENLDYFVSDGGSTDDSLEILRSYGDRVRWTSGPDGGQAAAIARAWAASDAEIVAWLNSDDTYLDGAISTAVNRMLAHPEAAVVYGQAWYTNAVGRRMRPYPTKPFDREALAAECFVCQPAAFVRREVFQVVDLPDANLRYSMDYDLWIRISRHFQIDYLGRFLATSRLHAENKTLGERGGAIHEAMLVARRHFGSVHPNWALMEARHRLRRLLAPLWMTPEPFRRWLSTRLASHLAGRIDGSPYEDGWTGPRTMVQVDRDESGVVSVDGEFPHWPDAGIVRVTASYGGRILAVQHVRGPSRFTITLRLPKSSPRRTSLLLETNQAFVPSYRYGGSDSRTLSFRIIRVRVGQTVSPDDLRLSGLLARVSGRLQFLPTAVRRTVCGTIARLNQPPVEAEPYEDGWVGRRTAVAVEPDPDGRVTLECECLFWPHKRPLQITVYYEGKALAVQTVGVGPFDLTFVLPRTAAASATVLLVANRSFAPSQYGLSQDQRPLSFRFLDVGGRSMHAPDEADRRRYHTIERRKVASVHRQRLGELVDRL